MEDVKEPDVKEPIETGALVKPTRELGLQLLKAAQMANRKRLEDGIVDSVQNVLAEVQRQEDLKAQCEVNIRTLSRQITAIEAGEFELERYDGSIVYNDSELNQDAVITECCRNCGQPVSGAKAVTKRR